ARRYGAVAVAPEPGGASHSEVAGEVRMRLARLCFVAVLVSFSSAGANDAIPMGRLPDSVEPRAYRLTLAIDPRQAEFSGTTDIDLSLREPARGIGLHRPGLPR